MEIEWSNGVVEVIKIVLGCFFAMRLLSKQIKSVRTIGKFGKFSFVDNRVWYNFIFCKAIVL